MGKTKMSKMLKNTELKITCHYNNESGKEVSETLRESFRIFVKNELARQYKHD